MGNYPAKRHFLAAVTAPLHRKRRARSAAHLQQLAAPAKSDTVVCLSPHPDDETISCGAYLAEAVGSGCQVHVVLITDGNAKGKKDKRQKEFVKATNTLGIPESHLHYLAYADGSLSSIPQRELENALVDILTPLRPTIILTPHPLDRHKDHAAVARASLPVANKLSCRILGYLDHFPPTFPVPRAHREDLNVLPPRSLKQRYRWVSYPVGAATLNLKRRALQQYAVELKTPVLRSQMLAFLRQNELYADLTP